jgi:uncharacterized membrane protein
MNYLENAFLYFFFYAVIGYLCEVTYVFIGTKKLVNRGFLYGPYIPIYGLGAFFVTTLLNEYNNDPVTIFILSMVICASLEYFISFLWSKSFIIGGGIIVIINIILMGEFVYKILLCSVLVH